MYTLLHYTRHETMTTWENLNSTNENAEQAHVSLDSTDEIYRTIQMPVIHVNFNEKVNMRMCNPLGHLEQ